jgi:hypothetical protein
VLNVIPYYIIEIIMIRTSLIGDGMTLNNDDYPNKCRMSDEHARMIDTVPRDA